MGTLVQLSVAFSISISFSEYPDLRYCLPPFTTTSFLLSLTQNKFPSSFLHYIHSSFPQSIPLSPVLHLHSFISFPTQFSVLPFLLIFILLSPLLSPLLRLNFFYLLSNRNFLPHFLLIFILLSPNPIYVFPLPILLNIFLTIFSIQISFPFLSYILPFLRSVKPLLFPLLLMFFLLYFCYHSVSVLSLPI